MIIDIAPPEPPKRHWPFLLAWSLAAIAIVLALFLSQTPASQQASVAVSASQAPSTSASVSRSVIVQQLPVGLYSTVQRIDGGRKLANGQIDPAWQAGGSLDESMRAARMILNGQPPSYPSSTIPTRSSTSTTGGRGLPW